jgi:hypothetical protein
MNTLLFLNIGAPEIIIILIFPLALFFILRQLMLWYWKINLIVENQAKQTNALERQNELMHEQIELLKAIKAQQGNNSIDPNSEAIRP